MAVRTITCLPAVIGAWRHAGGGALLSTSKLYPFDNAALERPDLIPPGTRTVNMVQLAEALRGELPGPPVPGLVRLQRQPGGRLSPTRAACSAGCGATTCSRSFTSSSRPTRPTTPTSLLPATTQLEHFDIHSATATSTSRPTSRRSPPLAEAKPNTEVFRLLAAAHGLRAGTVRRERRGLGARRPRRGEAGRGARGAFAGITLDRLRREGPIRLNLPHDYAPFAGGGFPTPSGKCELTCPTGWRSAASTRCRLRAAARRPADPARPRRTLPAANADPPPARVPEFDLRRTRRPAAGGRRAVGSRLHPHDAAARGIADGSARAHVQRPRRIRGHGPRRRLGAAGRGGDVRGRGGPKHGRRRQLQRDHAARR